MLDPETRLDIVRQRHSDLLRQARTGELAMRVAIARRQERRSFLARLRLAPKPRQASDAATSR